MADYVLIDGDHALFDPGFGAATVIVQPGALTGAGPSTLGGKRWCVVGDEASVTVGGCSYVTPSHPIPGTGTLQIQAIAADQQASKTHSGGVAVMLVGSAFTAKFAVQSPAKQPNPAGPPIPDPTAQYSGTGRFKTTNNKYRAT